MRLAYLYNGAVPTASASSVQVMRMCSAFRALGHDITLLSIKADLEGDAMSDREIADYYGCTHEFPIIPIREGRDGWLGFALRATRQVKALKPDLVFGRCVRSCAVAALRGFPVMHEAHGPIDAYSRSGQVALRYLAGSRNFRRLVVINHALAEHYVALFPRLVRPPLIAPSATDPVEDIPPIRDLAPGEKLRIGYVGSLYPGKGMELIAEMAEGLDHEFIVAGGDAETIAQWKRRLGERVTFLGQVPNRDVSALIASFDIALAPYLRNVSGAHARFNLARWMSPLKLFEYMAHGRPIVTSDLSAIREIVTPGVEAILCDPERPADWIAALDRLVSDVSLRKSLGAAALGTFNAKYEWKTRAQQIISAV